MHPVITFLFERKKRLSDIEFMSIKKFDGKFVDSEGSLTGIGTLTSITPASGKTFYLAEAKVETEATGAVITVAMRAEVQNDGVVVDELYRNFTGSGAGAGGSLGQEYSAAQGESLDGDGVKVFRIEFVHDTSVNLAHGYLKGYLEDTGTDPRV